ncbi:EAL domain-containing protein [Thiohalocapsa marina]|uniref:EAL domain-containing protein n=1 Tax=Thiohalocapsa marina TaxID=424902 RepID=UPI0036DCCF0D
MIEKLTLADLCATRPPVCCPPEQLLSAALSVMADARVSSIVVVQDERPVGIFTERDALALIVRDRYVPDTPLRDLMSPDPLTATAETSFVDGYARMAGRGFRHLVVVDADGRLQGLVSETDFARALGAEELLTPRRVADLMTRNPVSLPPTATVAEAMACMAEGHFSSVIIVEDARPVGILSERDAIRLVGNARDLRQVAVATEMSCPVHSIAPDAPAYDAGPRMLELNVRHLAVVADDGRLVGILGRHELLKDVQDVHVRLLQRVVEQQGNALQQQRLAGIVFENTSEGIMVTDADNRILTVNAAFTTITGYQANEVIGQNPRLLASGRQDAGFYHALWDRLQRTDNWSGEVWNRRKDEAVYPQWLNINLVRDSANRVVQHVAIFNDRSAARRSSEEIAYLRSHDPLTGLLNLTRLRERLAEALEQASVEQRRLAILVVNLDRFRDLVASHGPLAADEALKVIATRLAGLAGPADILARMTGDGFVIARPLETKRDPAVQAVQGAQGLQELVSQPLEIPELDGLSLSASLGIALYPEDGATVNTLLRNAESALKQAKQAGSSVIGSYRPELTQAARRRVQLETELRRALAGGDLRLLYQPIVAADSGALVAAEALIRWQHPVDGMVSPRDFIEAVERSDLVHSVGRWVIERAAEQALRWQRVAPVRVSVNVAAQQIIAGTLVRDLTEVLQRTGLDPALLGIEVLERTMLHDPAQALAELEKVRALGVYIALDDFGSGYSSLNHLKHLRVNALKIDRAFIRYLTTDATDEAIVTSTIGMAHHLGLQVVAEGVETEAQLAYLTTAGCDLVQGYLIGRPAEADALKLR